VWKPLVVPEPKEERDKNGSGKPGILPRTLPKTGLGSYPPGCGLNTREQTSSPGIKRPLPSQSFLSLSLGFFILFSVIILAAQSLFTFRCVEPR